MDTIEKDVVALISFTLTDDDDNILDQATAASPLPYLHGHKNVIEGLEEALDGLSVGDEFDVSCPPAKAFGEVKGPGPQGVKRKEFGKQELKVGMPIHAQGSDGAVMRLWVTELKGSWVYLDTNHPLAGKTVRFVGKVERIRPANENELEHGHPHGPDGTSHHH